MIGVISMRAVDGEVEALLAFSVASKRKVRVHVLVRACVHVRVHLRVHVRVGVCVQLCIRINMTIL